MWKMTNSQVKMGNQQITVISWPDSIYNADIVRSISDIRQSLGIDICNITYVDPVGYCSVRGNTAVGIERVITDTYLARLWHRRCCEFINRNPQYGLCSKDITMKLIKA